MSQETGSVQPSYDPSISPTPGLFSFQGRSAEEVSSSMIGYLNSQTDPEPGHYRYGVRHKRQGHFGQVYNKNINPEYDHLYHQRFPTREAATQWIINRAARGGNGFETWEVQVLPQPRHWPNDPPCAICAETPWELQGEWTS